MRMRTAVWLLLLAIVVTVVVIYFATRDDGQSGKPLESIGLPV